MPDWAERTFMKPDERQATLTFLRSRLNKKSWVNKPVTKKKKKKKNTLTSLLVPDWEENIDPTNLSHTKLIFTAQQPLKHGRVGRWLSADGLVGRGRRTLVSSPGGATPFGRQPTGRGSESEGSTMKTVVHGMRRLPSKMAVR